MKRLFCLAPLLVLSCGSPAAPSLGLSVRFDALLADEVRSLSLFALGPQRSDGIFLTCSTLLDRDFEPTDDRLELFDRADVAFVGPESTSITLDNIRPGNQRIVFGAATDAQSRTIARGCTDEIVVSAGATVDVELAFYRVP